MTRFLMVFGTASLGLLLTASAFAQISTAQLAGKVTDNSGAVLPGVTVTMTQADTGAARSVVTDAEGAYLVSNLSPGPYRLEVTLQGFKTYVQTGIVLQVAATPTINVALDLGGLEETVTVEAAAPLVDVKSAGVSEVVAAERIVELPLQGRQVTALLVLAGAAVNTGSPNSRSFGGAVNVAVAGGLPFGVAYLLDGAMHNDSQNNANLPLPFPDALQEFRVATTGLTAQNGMHSGASVNAITKSGTNRFSGVLFEFNRDARFNAKDPFARIVNGERANDGLSRNQFGGTAGGPLRRDKLFFFGAYQGTITNQTPADNITFVPPPEMLRGDFRTYASAACQGGTAVQLRAPFVGNQVDPSRLSPAALKLVSYLPAAESPCGEISFAQPADGKSGQSVARLDYQITGNHSMFGRYMATFDKAPSPYGVSAYILPLAAAAGIDNLAQSATWGDTMVVGSNLVNSLRLAFNRTSINRGNPAYFDPLDLGVKNFHTYRDGEMVVNVTGGFMVSAGTSTTGVFGTNSFQAADDLSLVRGRHQLGVGLNVAYWKSNQTSHARSGGNWLFNGQTTGRGLADLMIGAVGSVEHGVPNLLIMDMVYAGLYAQDAWRMSDRVTLNYGVRWEPFLGQQMLYGGATNFNHDNFANGVRSEVFLNAPAGLLYPGDAGFPGGKSGYNKRWLDFSPRAGIAWDVRGDGRLAFRSSYGLTYDFPSGDYMNINASAPPWGNRSLVTTTSFDDPYSVVPGGNPHPIATNANTVFPTFGAFGVMDPNIEPPRVQSWNITLEKQLWEDWSVTANYLGRYSDHLWGQVALNPGVFRGLNPCVINGVSYTVCSTNANLNQRRALFLENPARASAYGFVDQHNAVGWQAYQGMRLTLTRRATDSGVSISGNYTVSKCEGTTTPGSFAQIANGYTNPADPEMDKGHCDQDRTHLVNGTVGYLVPEFSNTALRVVASNWRVSGILAMQSGQWLNITTGLDNALNGQIDQRPNQVSDDVYGAKTVNSFLNRAAFAQPAPGTFGDMPYRAIEGPGYWAINVALSRIIRLGETSNLELRLESFNITNHFNWGVPTTAATLRNFTSLSSAQFGRITTNGGTPRIMQFGIKYNF